MSDHSRFFIKMRLLVILITLFVNIVYNAKCPGKLGDPCKSSHDCGRNQRCYRDLDDTPDSTKFYCCRMACPLTNLLTFHSSVDNTYLHKMDYRLNKWEEEFYKDPSLSIACPYPYSHARYQVENVLPVGFSVLLELKNCTTNGDCGRGFYCGATANPSFYSRRVIYRVLDKSDDGEPIKFCYRDPDVDKRYSIVFHASKIELPMCYNDSECLGIYEICYEYRKYGSYLRNITEEFWRGICVNSYPYSYATFGMENALPVGFQFDSKYFLKKCTRNRDCGEGFYCGFPINSEKKFCYKDPHFGKKYNVAFYSSKFGLPICNKDSECLGIYEICYQYGDLKKSQTSDDEPKWKGVCAKAYPYSRATIEIDKVLPVGFLVNSVDSLKHCTINGDCGEGFYCGKPTNPSLHSAPINITQLDKSDGGLTMKFCYKDPDFGKKYNVAFNASKIGLPICNKHSDCFGLWEICYEYGDSENLLNADDESKGRGICVKLYPYSHATIAIDMVLPVGFSFDSKYSLKNCTTNGDCGEGFYCGNTVNPLLNERSINDNQVDGFVIKFCYKDPKFDDTKFSIAFNASKIGLPICNGDLECVGMGAICYQYGESKDSLNADDKSKGRGICVKVMPISRGVVSLCGSQYCRSVDDCSGIQDEVYHPLCLPLENANTTHGSLCCFKPRMCEHGMARTPRVSCSSSADCNVGITGPWTSWCEWKEYCCHDTNGTVQHLCPDRATLMFNEPRCEGTCENGTCIKGRCCPELVIEDGVAKLGISPYITKMPCDPSISLSDHVRYSYCSLDGFVTVIGSNDSFGEAFLLNGGKECKTNVDCEQEGDMILCIRGNTTSSSCNKDPFKYYKDESSSLQTTIIVCIVIIVVILVVASIAIIFRWKKLQLKFKKLERSVRMKRDYDQALTTFQKYVTNKRLFCFAK